MTALIAHIILAICLAIILVPAAVLVVMDFRMMQLKGEAVARGYASVRDGEWEWVAPDEGKSQ